MPERSRVSEDKKDPLAVDLCRRKQVESARDVAEARWPKLKNKGEGRR